MLPINLKFEDSFFEEELQNEFFVDRKRKELWAVELDLLNEFDKVCRKYRLTYFLDGGSLLGAVRHKGFIPWDDDIDVNMLREDYDKLLEIAPKEFKGRYFFQHHSTEKGYIKGYAKLRNSDTTAYKYSDLKNKNGEFNQGVFIDIFPLDNLPEKDGFVDKERLKNQMDEINNLDRRLYRIIRTSHRHCYQRWLSYVRRFILQLIFASHIDVYNKRENIAKGNTKGKYVDEISFLLYEKLRILERDWYNEIDLVPFANLVCPIPKQYHKILCQYYGDDYMVPKQLATMHGELVYDTHCPYDVFLENYKKNGMELK